ncbi:MULTISPECIES: disulfide bond formation protein DsbB [Corallincola]|uniref:Disulfide bond formation protein B n=3 Tax=Corallincola TaxID=1775176 RepID=A0A368NIH0_9GAMM|nr:MULTISPECIES: disulfide bond formation protein DsbB [Corallincola]RCU50387.1 disulfide bond formation protein DsbB [Corallincola holothuriorum]TAA48602.1 disulfide bond formation protein DsbB [Corallincola spongiicola]TCI05539.1 disulfide bond formation protein DsbB [Corallincola luteus]
MITQIGNWPTQRWPWLLLGGSALALELCALFFQYGMDLAPCIMCIYERVAMLGIMLTGLITAISPQLLWLRLLGFCGWLVSAGWGLILAWEHVQLQLYPSPFHTCDFEPNFPEWLQLHKLLPIFFEATGDCGEIAWSFLGWSMPQWLVVSFIVYLGLLFAVIACWGISKLKKA